MAVLVSKFSSPLPVNPISLAGTYGEFTGKSNGRKVRGSDGQLYWVTRTGPQHNGVAVDIAAVAGTPVYAVAGGKVLTAGLLGDCGKTVRIQHAGGWLSKSCHLSQIVAQVGQSVRQRQIVGYTGCTGSCGGNHLHFVLIDPNGNRVPDPIRVLGVIGTSQLMVWSGVGLGLAAVTYGVYHATQKGV